MKRRLTAIVVGVILTSGAVLVQTGAVGFYNGLNKGVTVGGCAFEIVGDFGPFCGDQITLYPLPTE